MINSRRGAQVINGAGNHNANNPKEKIEIDEPRFKGRLHGNHIGFQQGKHNNEENAGEHVRNQFCHTLKIIQSNTIDVNSLKKDIVKQDITGFFTATPFRMTKTQIKKTGSFALLRKTIQPTSTVNFLQPTTSIPLFTSHCLLPTTHILLFTNH